MSFLSVARMVRLLTSARKARKVTGLPNSRLEKSICSVTTFSSCTSGTLSGRLTWVLLSEGLVFGGRPKIDVERGESDLDCKLGPGIALDLENSLHASA